MDVNFFGLHKIFNATLECTTNRNTLQSYDCLCVQHRLQLISVVDVTEGRDSLKNLSEVSFRLCLSSRLEHGGEQRLKPGLKKCECLFSLIHEVSICYSFNLQVILNLSKEPEQ